MLPVGADHVQRLQRESRPGPSCDGRSHRPGPPGGRRASRGSWRSRGRPVRPPGCSAAAGGSADRGSRPCTNCPRSTGLVCVPFAVTFATLACVRNPPRTLSAGSEHLLEADRLQPQRVRVQIVVPGEPGVENRPVRVRHLSRGTVVGQHVFEGPPGLLHHRGVQQFVVLRGEFRVRHAGVDPGQIEPLIEEVVVEPDVLRIGQHPLRLSPVDGRVRERAVVGPRPQFVVGDGPPEHETQATGQRVRGQRVRGQRVRGERFAGLLAVAGSLPAGFAANRQEGRVAQDRLGAQVASPLRTTPPLRAVRPAGRSDRRVRPCAAGDETPDRRGRRSGGGRPRAASSEATAYSFVIQRFPRVCSSRSSARPGWRRRRPDGRRGGHSSSKRAGNLHPPDRDRVLRRLRRRLLTNQIADVPRDELEPSPSPRT